MGLKFEHRPNIIINVFEIIYQCITNLYVRHVCIKVLETIKSILNNWDKLEILILNSIHCKTLQSTIFIYIYVCLHMIYIHVCLHQDIHIHIYIKLHNMCLHSQMSTYIHTYTSQTSLNDVGRYIDLNKVKF